MCTDMWFSIYRLFGDPITIMYRIQFEIVMIKLAIHVQNVSTGYYLDTNGVNVCVILPPIMYYNKLVSNCNFNSMDYYHLVEWQSLRNLVHLI